MDFAERIILQNATTTAAPAPNESFYIMINILGTVGPFVVMIVVGIAEFLSRRRGGKGAAKH